MALIRSFVRRAMTADPQLNRKTTDCEFFETVGEEDGRMLVLRTYSENRTPESTPAQVYDLDLEAAQRLRTILNEVFGI